MSDTMGTANKAAERGFEEWLESTDDNKYPHIDWTNELSEAVNARLRAAWHARDAEVAEWKERAGMSLGTSHLYVPKTQYDAKVAALNEEINTLRSTPKAAEPEIKFGDVWQAPNGTRYRVCTSPDCHWIVTLSCTKDSTHGTAWADDMRKTWKPIAVQDGPADNQVERLTEAERGTK